MFASTVGAGAGPANSLQDGGVQVIELTEVVQLFLRLVQLRVAPYCKQIGSETGKPRSENQHLPEQRQHQIKYK